MKMGGFLSRGLTIGFAFILVTLSGAASAECSSYGCSGYVDEVYIEAESGLWLQTSGNEQLANCAADSGVFLRLDGNAAKFKEVYALLLLAQTTDKQVFVRIQEGSSPCKIVYVRLFRNQ